MRVAGLLLAAGAGSRMGRPKALVDDWLVRSVGVLVDGGCASLTVVLGASADEARGLLAQASFAVPPQVVVACDWAEGLSASLREGLRVLVPGRADAALVR
jgi:CTP:molybdopterin cytidylyltransferase MocA